MDYSYTPRRKRRSLKKLLLLIIVLVGIGYAAWNYFLSTPPFTLVGSSSLKDTVAQVFSPQPKPIDVEVLSSLLASPIKEFADKNWKLGLYLSDPKTKSSYSLNADQTFTAASLTKIPVLMTVYDEIQQGRMTYDQKLTINANDWQVYGTSVIPYRPGASYKVKDLLWYLVNRSDNTAFQKFVNHLSIKKIHDNLYTWGFQISNIVDNITTPAEMGRMFDLIYHGKLIKDKTLLKDMLSLMVDTNEEDRIPAGVPDGVRVIHKTGNLVGGLQDSGVVELKDRPYFITILSGNVNDEKRLEELEAEISKIVYSYLEKLY